jgi:threonylcarbamoyladenosine tRNA methylthiotransferase MtaB
MTESNKSFHILTLGCKANQYDSAVMADDLARRGFAPAALADASLVVVNGCAVTASSEGQCRRALRRARRENPRAVLAAAGCAARSAGQALAALPGVDIVLAGGPGWPEDPAVAAPGRSRPLLKIQDGCSGSCAYCVVPLLRGAPRSLPPERAVAAVRSLMERGAAEVVLTGIHLGSYGADLGPGATLDALLRRLLAAGLHGRLRLSSLDAPEITDRLLALVAGSGGRVCRHLHIPLQSGSDRVLAAMGRPGRAVDFADAVRRARAALPGVGIGCDLIAGFPGESEQDFLRSLEAVENNEVPFVHAFPFSPRPGTAAAILPDDVPFAVKRERVRALTEAGARNLGRFLAGFVGHRLPVVFEGGRDRDGRRHARADNALMVMVAEGERASRRGAAAEALVTGVAGDALLAESAADRPGNGRKGGG